MKNYHVTYTFPSKEARENFLREVTVPADISRKEQGCLQYEYYYPAGSDTKLLLLEQWERAADQELHTKQPHFALIGKLKEKYGAVTEVKTWESM